MQGQGIEQIINQAKEWIKNHRRGDNPKPILWTLHYDSSLQKINSKSPRIDSYMDDQGDNDEAVYLLESALRRASMQPYRFMLITLRTSAKDGDPMLFPFENPNQGNQGFPQQQMGLYGGFDAIGFMQSMFTQQMGYMMQMNDMQRKMDMERWKMEQERKDMKDELESTKSAKIGFLDKVIDRVPWEMILERFLAPGSSNEEEIDDSGSHAVDEDLAAKTNAAQQQLANDLRRIQAVFPDVHVFINELAAFMEKDPKNAGFYRNMMKNQNH